MWRLNVSFEAELEIFQAALRYEREREGLGFRFDAQVNTVFTRLLNNPLQFPIIEQDVRRALVRDFPYAVFFVADAHLITMLAVLHLRRHPDTWKRRRRDTE
jgi:hypothetical protein